MVEQKEYGKLLLLQFEFFMSFLSNMPLSYVVTYILELEFFEVWKLGRNASYNILGLVWSIFTLWFQCLAVTLESKIIVLVIIIVWP